MTPLMKTFWISCHVPGRLDEETGYGKKYSSLQNTSHQSSNSKINYF